MMRELIDEIFAPALANPQLTPRRRVALPVPEDRDLMVTPTASPCNRWNSGAISDPWRCMASSTTSR